MKTKNKLKKDSTKYYEFLQLRTWDFKFIRTLRHFDSVTEIYENGLKKIKIKYEKTEWKNDLELFDKLKEVFNEN